MLRNIRVHFYQHCPFLALSSHTWSTETTWAACWWFVVRHGALCVTGGISAAVATRIIWPRLNVAVVPRWRCWFVSRQRILEVLAERKTLFRFHQKANWTHIHCAEGLDVYDKIKRLIRNVAISLKNAVTSLFFVLSRGVYFANENKILKFLSLEISDIFF